MVFFGDLTIALTVIGALTDMAPSDRVFMLNASIEITPNVARTVTEVAAKANTPLKRAIYCYASTRCHLSPKSPD